MIHTEDACPYCAGELVYLAAKAAAWLFRCKACGRLTVYTDEEIA